MAGVTAALRAHFDRVWPEGWTTHACPRYDGRTFTHGIRFHQ